MTQPAQLTAAQLRRRCDPAQFTFATTAEAPGQETIIGQDRATRAIEFGMAMPYPGYNVFATGPAGAGKSSILTRFLKPRPVRVSCRPIGATSTISAIRIARARCVCRRAAASSCANR